MNRKIPNCAWCGKSMSMRRAADLRRGRILDHFRGLPGSPMVGWHHDCADADPIFRQIENRGAADRQDHLRDVISRINLRGTCRVSATPAIWPWIAKR